MNLKEILVLSIFIISFVSFIFLTQPSYTGYVIQEDISSLQAMYNDSEASEILGTLGIDFLTAISTLNAYDLQAQKIEQDITLTDENKSAQIANLEIEVADFLLDMPQAFQITNRITGLPATPVEDIMPEMLYEELDSSTIDEIYLLQNQLEARTDLKTFEVLTYSGDQFIGTYITKTIKTPVLSGYVLEVIPQEIAPSADDLIFIGNYEIKNQDPLMLSIPITTGAVVYSYIIPKDISFLSDKIQTVVIPYEVTPTASRITAYCGDSICTEYLEDEIICPEDCARKIPWTLIIIMIIILVVLIILIQVFKSKNLNLKNLFKRKEKLFDNETDKENLKNYIKHSFEEGVEESQIRTILLAKGWSIKQINLVIQEINKEKLETYRESTPLEKETPEEESESLDDYFESKEK